MYKVDLLVPFACLRSKVIRARDLTKQVVSAILITGRGHIRRETAVLIPQEETALGLILFDTLSKSHNRVRAHVCQVLVSSEIREQPPVWRVLFVGFS